MRHETISTNTPRRRGLTIVFVVVMIPVLLGAAALTIDVGLMINTRADLQIAADASALAGVAALSSDDMMRVRMRADDTSALVEVKRMAQQLAGKFSAYNPSFATKTTHIDPHDVTVGWIDLTGILDRSQIPISIFSTTIGLCSRTTATVPRSCGRQPAHPTYSPSTTISGRPQAKAASVRS